MALNPEQFFSGLDSLDRDHPTPAFKQSSGAKFYHGTTANVQDKVLPAQAVNKNASEHSMGDPGDMSEGDHAFAIKNDENYAWHAAGAFHKNGRRPRVYEVDPAPDMVPGPHHVDHPDFLHNHDLDDPKDVKDPLWHKIAKDAVRDNSQDEYGSRSGFPVKKRIDIMPGRQGTFPEVNWNRFKDPEQVRPSWGPDANHPNDEQVKYGIEGHPQTRDGDGPEHHGPTLNGNQFPDWNKDPAPHSVLRETLGRPQKRWATLLD